MTHAYEENPCVVVWELTRKCNNSCTYCPSCIEDEGNTASLTLKECLQLIDELTGLGNPDLTITGGDIFEHPSFFHLLQYGINKGLTISLSPAITSKLTTDNLRKAKEAGVSKISIGLDGHDAVRHDSIRGFLGSYRLTKDILDLINELEFEIEINTIITKQNLYDLEAIYKEIKGYDQVGNWNLWMLVPLLNKQDQNSITSKEYELVFHWLDDLRKSAPFKIVTTAGQHFQRIILQNQLRNKLISEEYVQNQKQDLTAKTYNDGNGILFITHSGDIYPSELLRIRAGNVKDESIRVVYRYSPLFKKLRTPNLLKGKCGLCEYRYVCGGSRARAYAITGDYLQSEPYCDYVPKAMYMRKQIEEAL